MKNSKSNKMTFSINVLLKLQNISTLQKVYDFYHPTTANEECYYSIYKAIAMILSFCNYNLIGLLLFLRND